LPSWLLDDEAGGAFARILAGLADTSAARVRAGLEQRFPSRADAAALAMIGQYRLIPRGRDETAAHYAARLKAWRYPRGHRVRGNVFALLEQISEYFGGATLLGIDARGNARQWLPGGDPYTLPGNTWTWDSRPASEWARQWIILYGVGVGTPEAVFTEQPDFGDPTLWGGALGTDGYCVGIGGSSAADWRAIRDLCRGQHRWLPAGVQGEWLIVDLVGVAGILDMPDATWSRWGYLDGTVYKPARSRDLRYVALRDALREYPGDPTVWADTCETNLGEFGGDPTSFPATITLPDGTAYAGDPGAFPATITLPDDGSNPR
jgi:hypothetical protein